MESGQAQQDPPALTVGVGEAALLELDDVEDVHGACAEGLPLAQVLEQLVQLELEDAHDGVGAGGGVLVRHVEQLPDLGPVGVGRERDEVRGLALRLQAGSGGGVVFCGPQRESHACSRTCTIAMPSATLPSR